MKWAGHVALMHLSGEEKHVQYMVFVGKPEEKESTGENQT
jgi:hypothetical protein